jgi:hypothetical protein
MAERKQHMEIRHHPRRSLDYFPTPPWAVRALIHELLDRQVTGLKAMSVHEPAVGGGHMLGPLREAFGTVTFSDVADWGINAPIRDFTYETVDSLMCSGIARPDWIITNPPYEIGHAFFTRGYEIARDGLALLLRLGWMAGQERYEKIFAHTPPTYICPFAERVPMIEGAWDPEASSATDYAWYVWVKPQPEFQWGSLLKQIRPGMEDLYTRQADMALAKPGEAKRRAEARKAGKNVDPYADLFGAMG